LPPRSWVLFAFLAYLFAASLSVVGGVDVKHSIWSDYKRMLGFWDLAHWFLLVVVAASVLRSPRSWHTLLNWNLAAILVVALLALGQTFGISPLWYLRRLFVECRVDATLGNPSYLAAILVVGILLAVGFLVRSFLPREDQAGARSEGASTPARGQRRRRQAGGRGGGSPSQRAWMLVGTRLFWGATAALGLWVLFLTGTRGALVGLVGGAVGMPLAAAVWADRRVLWPLALAAGGILLAVAALFALDHTIGIPVAPDCRGYVTSARLFSAAGPLKPSTAEAPKEASGGAGLAETVRLLVTAGPLDPTVAEAPKEAVGGVGLAETVLGPRFLVAGIGLRAFRDRPLLGWGQDNFARAFDRFAEASLYRYGTDDYDQAHNKVIEEMATKGSLGALAYVALWGALAWAVIRRRRPLREEALAYAVLGALGGYFLQNLFLFDTPGMLLQWALLVGWVAGQEQAPRPAIQAPVGDSRRRRAAASPEESRRAPFAALWSPWARGLLAAAALVAVGLSLYLLNYRPYTAAHMHFEAKTGKGALAARLDQAEQGFSTFPGLATLPRQEVLVQLVQEWDRLNPEERRLALQFATKEAALAWEQEPRNARLLAASYVLVQATAASPEALERLEPVVTRLRALAPDRIYTQQFWAVQEVLKGNYLEALRIIEDFQTRAPATEPLFQPIVQDAKEGLARRGRSTQR
ncbi:MAG: O-antigen ligase family protein, partial [Chloroflexi bacterium]|nr:O-antigen ligase family protein [Chloroflexota bacterium]